MNGRMALRQKGDRVLAKGEGVGGGDRRAFHIIMQTGDDDDDDDVTKPCAEE